MKKLSPFLFMLLIFLSFNTTQAAPFYRHIPFAMVLTSDDKLIVHYDLSGKAGIRCTSPDNHAISVEFTYKGRQKLASLPVTLQNHRIPKEKGEELIDLTGRFILSNNNPIHYPPSSYTISCHYADMKFAK